MLCNPPDSMKFILSVLITTFLFISPVWGQTHTISGFLLDAQNGEHLIGAHIINQKTSQGSPTNTFGFYSLSQPRDSVDLIFSYVGYKSQRVRFFLAADTSLQIRLEPLEILDELVITAQTDKQVEEVQMSRIEVPIAQIKSMPALLGEVDVLKVLQLMPGVQSGTEGGSGLYVRGGGPDQNLILLDGVPVYNANHLFGFFSVFNSDAINHVELFKGGFPARYGGRLSSVIDIQMKEGNQQEWHGEGGIGLIASRLTVEGPLKKEKSSLLFSARRTYIDILARPIIKAANESNATAGYYFYDLNTKLNYRISQKNRLYLSAYLGSDRFYARDTYSYSSFDGSTYRTEENNAGINWGNITTALRWNHVYSPRLFSNSTITYSRYRFNVLQEFNSDWKDGSTSGSEHEKGLYFSGIRDFAFKHDFDFVPVPHHYLRFGGNLILHRFSPGALEISSTTQEDVSLGDAALDALEFFAYAEDDVKINDRLKLNAGLHFSGFNTEARTYLSLQPRLSMRYMLRHDLSLKASYARMAQYIHLLTNSGLGLPTDLWVPSTSSVLPEQSQQYALGVSKLWRSVFEFSIEGYYKDMRNLLEYQQGSSFEELDKKWEDRITTGDGNSYGAEFFLQKKKGITSGWVGYTLSWTNRQFDALNFGMEFPYKYDRRHDLSIAVIHRLSEKAELSGTWVYGTGVGLTIPVAFIESKDDNQLQNPRSGGNWGGYNRVTIYSARNAVRMPSYHRLDFSYRHTKKKRWGERSWVLGVYNLYNRKNPFYIDIKEEYNENTGALVNRKFVQYSLFQLIPSISYNFKF